MVNLVMQKKKHADERSELKFLVGDVIYDGMACRTMNDVAADCQSAKYEEKNKREPDDSRTEQKHTSGLYPEATDKIYSGIKCRANRQRRSKLMRPKRTGAFNSPLLLLSPRSITALALRGGPKERINSALTRGEGNVL